MAETRQQQLRIADALRSLAPSLELNVTSKYASLDVGPAGTKPKNAVHLSFSHDRASFYVPDWDLVQHATAAGLLVTPVAQKSHKYRIEKLTPELIQEHEDLFRQILTGSIQDVNARRARKVATSSAKASL